MKVVIIGAGRMGIRHAQGIEAVSAVSEICLVDISEDSLMNATQLFANSANFSKFKFSLATNFSDNTDQYDVAVIASTAGDRLETLSTIISKNVKHVLLEKPLGQSLEEVEKIKNFLDQFPAVKSYVNFAMRLNPSMIELKKDLNNLPQMVGPKTITINMGAIGIGSNGVHYLDMCYFLFNANKAKIVAAEIEDNLIQSGRGPQFNDFGGWGVIHYYKNEEYVGKLILSISSTSTAFGAFEIVGTHGRIHYDDVREIRTDSLRNEDSNLPMYRYHGDYVQDITKKVTSAPLSELTKYWLENLIEGNAVLPSVENTINIHELLFNWLNKSKTHSKIFPIT
jgi:predicted dehydrogenase